MAKKAAPADIQIQSVETLHDGKFLRLMETSYTFNDKPMMWWWASRNGERTVKPDAVMIVALVKPNSRSRKYKLLVTDEYRVPLEGREFGFPAGLIEDGDASLEDRVATELHQETGLEILQVFHELTPKPNLISSAGMSNESVTMVFIEAQGKISQKNLEVGEDINAALLDFDQVMELLNTPGINMSAKMWGILFGFRLAGKLTFEAFKKRKGSPRKPKPVEEPATT